MKFICEREKLLKAINSVVKGVASKTTMPILEGILIQTNDNEIKLTTYDLEIGIEYIIESERLNDVVLSLTVTKDRRIASGGEDGNISISSYDFMI